LESSIVELCTSFDVQLKGLQDKKLATEEIVGLFELKILKLWQASFFSYHDDSRVRLTRDKFPARFSMKTSTPGGGDLETAGAAQSPKRQMRRRNSRNQGKLFFPAHSVCVSR
jgi:hypothetical protein